MPKLSRDFMKALAKRAGDMHKESDRIAKAFSEVAKWSLDVQCLVEENLDQGPEVPPNVIKDLHSLIRKDASVVTLIEQHGVAKKPPARAGMPSKKSLKPPPLSAKKRPAETEPAKTNKKIIKSDEFMKLTKALQRHSYDAIKLEAEHQKTWQSLFDDIEGMKRNSMNQATRMLVYNVFLVASRKYWPSKDWNAIGVAMALGTQPATKAKSTYKALQTETANDFQFYIQKLAMNAPP